MKGTSIVAVNVLPRNEPPKILDGPREMSHWERDRENKIDGGDDDSILDYRQLDTDLDTTFRDEATYTAFNPEFENQWGGLKSSGGPWEGPTGTSSSFWALI